MRKLTICKITVKKIIVFVNESCNDQEKHMIIINTNDYQLIFKLINN